MSSILKLHQLDILSFKVLQRLGLWCYLVLNNSSFCSPRHIFFSSATRLFLQFKFERSSWQNTAIFLCESVHILVCSELKAEQEQVVQTMYRLCADYVWQNGIVHHMNPTLLQFNYYWIMYRCTDGDVQCETVQCPLPSSPSCTPAEPKPDQCCTQYICPGQLITYMYIRKEFTKNKCHLKIRISFS